MTFKHSSKQKSLVVRCEFLFGVVPVDKPVSGTKRTKNAKPISLSFIISHLTRLDVRYSTEYKLLNIRLYWSNAIHSSFHHDALGKSRSSACRGESGLCACRDEAVESSLLLLYWLLQTSSTAQHHVVGAEV